MKMKNILPITEARKKIFAIANEIEKKKEPYTLTYEGKPKVVLLSAESFETLVRDSARSADSVADARYSASGNSSGFFLSENTPQYGIKEPVPRYILPSPLPWVVVRDALRGVGDYHHDRELIKAQLYVQLAEKYGYPVRLIDIGKYIRIGSERSRKYVEVDLVVNDESGKARIIFAALPEKAFEEQSDEAVQELFDVAREIPWAHFSPNLLICFTRYGGKNQREEKSLAVDYEKYKSFLAWKKAGKPKGESIPKYV